MALRILRLARLALLGGLACGGVLLADAASCTGLAVKASVSKRTLRRGKGFQLTVAIDDQSQSKGFHGASHQYGRLALQVSLPEGVYFAKASKPLKEPAFWGPDDTQLLWSLNGKRRKRTLRIKLGVACTSQTSALQQLSFGVSVARLNEQGSVTCSVDSTVQVRRPTPRACVHSSDLVTFVLLD